MSHDIREVARTISRQEEPTHDPALHAKWKLARRIVEADEQAKKLTFWSLLLGVSPRRENQLLALIEEYSRLYLDKK